MGFWYRFVARWLVVNVRHLTHEPLTCPDCDFPTRVALGTVVCDACLWSRDMPRDPVQDAADAKVDGRRAVSQGGLDAHSS